MGGNEWAEAGRSDLAAAKPGGFCGIAVVLYRASPGGAPRAQHHPPAADAAATGPLQITGWAILLSRQRAGVAGAAQHRDAGDRTRAFEPIQTRAEALPAPADTVFLKFGEAPLPDYIREGAVTDRAFASNLEVLGRGLAAIGYLFVFHRLSFVEGRKASFLDRRNMNKNVLAAT